MKITDYDKLQAKTKELEADLLEADLVTENQLERIWLNCQYSPDTLTDYFDILFKKWLDNFDIETMTENIKSQEEYEDAMEIQASSIDFERGGNF